MGHLEAALEMAERGRALGRQAVLGHGPSSPLDVEWLKVLARHGRPAEALELGRLVRQHSGGLSQTEREGEWVEPWLVAADLLHLLVSAALGASRWEDALTFNAEAVALLRRRGAARSVLSAARFNAHAGLLRLDRTDEARRLLLNCRGVAEADRDAVRLARVLGALADVESTSRRHAEAVAYQHESLRLRYRMGQVGDIAAGHYNLAQCLRRGDGDDTETLAHRLAALLVWAAAGTALTPERLRTLALDLHRCGLADVSAGAPITVDAIARLVDPDEQLGFRPLVRQRLEGTRSTEELLAFVVHQAAELPDEEAYEIEYVRHICEPLASAVVRAARGDEEYGRALPATLDDVAEQNSELAALTAVGRRRRAGNDLLNGLDAADRAVVKDVLEALLP